MRWLTSRLIRAERERGASVVLVAVLVTAVLFGLGAFIIDLGAYYTARGETQNGADAAVIAIANTCAKGTCDATAGDKYGGLNSGNLDTAGSVTHQSTPALPCGNGPGLTACDPSIENGQICPAKPGSTHYVDAQVRTDKNGGVPAFFSAVFGNGRKRIGSCAQAIWGPPKLGVVLALTFAECTWNTDTAGNSNYAPSPPALPPTSFEKTLILHNPDDPTDPSCVSGPNVGPLPGGFGWTVPTTNPNTPCTATLIPGSGGWYESDPGNGTSTGTQCTDKGNTAGVIPCAQNPVVTSPPFSPNPLNACPTPATPSPLLVPIYDKVCSMSGSATTQDEIQSVTVSSKATGGSYTLTFTDNLGNAQTTGLIAWNANAAAIQTALTGLSNIGAGNVTVTGTLAAGFSVEFTGAFADTNMQPMVADSTKLTGKGNPTVDIKTVQDGSFAATACPAGSFFTSGNKYYHLLTLAAFVVTGYGGSSFAHDQRSWLTGNKCPANKSGCIMGYFVRQQDPGGDVDPNGTDAGVTVVTLNG
jgi:Flp pilus assembly protein TadG